METPDETIVRLTGELEDAQLEKVQAAEYGLQVLEEKRQLQHQCEELESQLEMTQRELENARHEFDLSTKALYSTKTKTKKAFCEGELREDSLEKQCKDVEERLIQVEKERDIESSQSKIAVANAQEEADRLTILNNELNMSVQALDQQRIALRRDLKELKSREAHLMADYSELEEENCSLQKQVSVLRQSQAEYEGFKHEIRRLEEEAEFLNSQLEEALKLKDLLEHQLDDAHETIAKERELKLSLKRELSQHMNQYDMATSSFHDNLSKFVELNNSRHQDGGSNTNSFHVDNGDDELDHPLIRHITSDLLHSTPSKRLSSESKGEDLLSELNLCEVTKLKQQLSQIENENLVLINTVKEQEKLLKNAQGELTHKTETNEVKYLDLVSECERLKEDLKTIRDEQAERKDAQKKSEIALKESKSKQMMLTQRNQALVEEIESSNHALSCRVKDARHSAEELSVVSEELSQLYHHACLAAGDTPQRVVLDSIRKETKQMTEQSEGKDQDKSEDKENILPKENTSDYSSDTVTTTTVLSTMRDQLKCLRGSIEKLATNKETSCTVTLAPLPGQTSLAESQEQVRLLEEEVLRLRSLLSSKREQIATLRTVLKANKHTAEVAISNLKSKYQHEKLFVSETMLKLRGELKALKEDAVTFAQLRMMFAARCDEYVAQLDAMQRHLASAEEEKRTLNTLLRKTITQKLAITQRLEDLEFDREQQTRKPKNSYASAVSHGNKKKPPTPKTASQIFR
uniref:protein bicaudal D homolog 2-like isoform X2 n=1 Tax=Ciona intestinalis TaxID=7719 RepID=UPI000180B410|nr:protein bicaudal D homolog 2-like isoform X2 [Ciona intestinalis]|eukprot:XP_002124456.1 protein bicaudal D homolog 2-like isoform X2 [Ciona intestinalis]